MVSFFGKLKAKKGFTLTELIVVVAIIGILIAMVVPVIFYDNRPARGKVLAKDFFYVTQDAMTSLKSSSPEAFSGSAGLFGESNGSVIFYANIADDGRLTESGVLISRTKISFQNILAGHSSLSLVGRPDLKRMIEKMRTSIEAYTASMDGMRGTLFAVVDKDYRTQIGYWTDILDEDVIGVGTAISTENDDSYILNGEAYYFVSYPTQYSLAGTTVFAYT